MKFKLWAEDSTSPPLSGRRFREIYKLVSPVRTPYVSLDFKNLDLDTWLALITRDGLLTVLEPVAPDNLSEWNQVDQWRVCPIPPRGEETSFKLSFHHDPLDTTHTISDGAVPKKTLSLVVAVNDTVKIYRTGAFDQRFYHAIELPGHGGLVRDVAWANGSVRGFDLIATACKDGYVRVFEVYTTFVNLNHTHNSNNNNNNNNGTQATKEKDKTVLALTSASNDTRSNDGSRPSSSSGMGISHLTRDPPPLSSTTQQTTATTRTSHHASGIGSALAGVQHHHTASQVGSRDAAGNSVSNTIGNAGGGFEFRHSAHEVGGLVSRHRDVWEVEFSYAGMFILFLILSRLLRRGERRS